MHRPRRRPARPDRGPPIGWASVRWASHHPGVVGPGPPTRSTMRRGGPARPEPRTRRTRSRRQYSAASPGRPSRRPATAAAAHRRRADRIHAPGPGGFQRRRCRSPGADHSHRAWRTGGPRRSHQGAHCPVSRATGQAGNAARARGRSARWPPRRWPPPRREESRCHAARGVDRGRTIASAPGDRRWPRTPASVAQAPEQQRSASGRYRPQSRGRGASLAGRLVGTNDPAPLPRSAPPTRVQRSSTRPS